MTWQGAARAPSGQGEDTKRAPGRGSGALPDQMRKLKRDPGSGGE